MLSPQHCGQLGLYPAGETQCRSHTSELAAPRGEGSEVFIHHLRSVVGEGGCGAGALIP